MKFWCCLKFTEQCVCVYSGLAGGERGSRGCKGVSQEMVKCEEMEDLRGDRKRKSSAYCKQKRVRADLHQQIPL